jgi:predicted acylesterase/phospholipase RssA
LNGQAPEETAYDVVTGVSVGALNGAGLAQFPRGQEKAAVDFLVDIWTSMGKKDVYKGWKPFGLLTGLTSRSGIFDNTPLRELVYAKFTGAIARKFSYGVTNAETG